MRLFAIRQQRGESETCVHVRIRSLHRTQRDYQKVKRRARADGAAVGSGNRAQRGRCVWSGIIYYMGCNYNISTDQY